MGAGLRLSPNGIVELDEVGKMHGPFPPAVNRSDIYISGDVTIEERVIIGPGVVLQATPGSRLIVRAGVCLGAGAVLHAHEGLLEIQADAIVGARSLIVGTGTVGASACLGAESTVLSPDIAPQQSIANGALVDAPSKPAPKAQSSNGVCDNGRGPANGRAPTTELEEDLWGEPEPETLPRSLDPIGLQAEPTQTASAGEQNGSTGEVASEAKNTTAGHSNNGANHVPQTEEAGQSTGKDEALSPPSQTQEVVIGGDYVRQLMVTLFPHKQQKL